MREAGTFAVGSFMMTIADELKQREGNDTQLTEILRKHLLVENPTEDCIEMAMSAITSLAALRAAGVTSGES